MLQHKEEPVTQILQMHLEVALSLLPLQVMFSERNENVYVWREDQKDNYLKMDSLESTTKLMLIFIGDLRK